MPKPDHHAADGAYDDVPVGNSDGAWTLMINPAIGRTVWAIADGHIPAWSNGPQPEMTSHESLSILNTGEAEAHVEMHVFFSDRDPIGPYRLNIAPRRTRHVRCNDLSDPEPIPKGVDYSVILRSDTPVVVQHTRLDSRQSQNALISTIAFSE